VPASHLGRAFGLERAADSAGAIVGPLLAAALIGSIGYRRLFAVSFVPALGAALSVLLLAREAPRAGRTLHAVVSRLRDLVAVPGRFRTLLVGVGLYGLGNFSATLLILRATDLLAPGRTPVEAASIAVLLYTGHNAANAVAAYPAGVLADRIGRRFTLMSGIALFALASFLFALGGSGVPLLALLFAAVGASTALVETGEGSHASELLPEEIWGRGFGLLGLVDGVGDLVSSLVVGILWTVTAPAWGFVYAGVLSLAGVAVLIPGVRLTTRTSGR